MSDTKTTQYQAENNGLAANLLRWGVLVQGVKHNLRDLAYTEPHNTQLKTLLEEILRSTAEQKAVTARLRALIRERQTKVQQARDLRNRLTAAVMGTYGPSSLKLREFGLRPRSRRRKAMPKKEVPSPS